MTMSPYRNRAEPEKLPPKKFKSLMTANLSSKNKSIASQSSESVIIIIIKANVYNIL